MYFVLYDRNLNTIGSTYVLENWHRTRRAYDYDDMSIEGERIPDNAEPFFVVVNDKTGHMNFSGLAGTPENDDETNKTKITIKDYRTLFNSDIVIDWSQFKGTTFKDLLDFVLNLWKTQNGEIGFDNIEFDTNEVSDILLDTEIDLGQEKESFQVYEFLSENMYYYSAYTDVILDIYVKKLTFAFKKVGTRKVSVKLADFDIGKVAKDFGEYNQATVYTSDFVKQGTWILTADNAVAKLEDGKTFNRIYPVKNRNFVAASTEADALNSAIYDAIFGLAENRYAESFDLDINANAAGEYIRDIGFDTSVEVYTADGYYKTLPIGEIEQDSDDTHIIRVGYRAQELTQIL